MDICTLSGIYNMEKNKITKKEPLNEEQILHEFFGKLVTKIFNSKALKVGKKMFKDPRMVKAFDDYVEDTKKFKQELKRLGLTSRQDLIDATKNDPNLKTYKDFI